MRARANGEHGFTLIELLIVVGLLGVIGAMAAMLGPGMWRRAKADAGIEQAVAVLRNAREVAITERRNVRIVFVGVDEIQTVRENLPIGSGTTTLSRVRLENGMRFTLMPGMPDTPDLFGAGAAIAFGASATRMFTSEGSFVDANGDPLNGSLFIGNPAISDSARAVTVFGPTALLRVWRWNGRAWAE